MKFLEQRLVAGGQRHRKRKSLEDCEEPSVDEEVVRLAGVRHVMNDPKPLAPLKSRNRRQIQHLVRAFQSNVWHLKLRAALRQ